MRVDVPIPWNTSGCVQSSGTYQYRKDGSTTYTESKCLRYCAKSRSPLRSGFTSSTMWRYATLYDALIYEQRSLSQHVSSRIYKSNRYTRYPGIGLATLDAVRITDPALAPKFSNLAAAADTGALKKLNDTHIEFGVALLEARKTIGHLASTAMRIFRLIRAMRKGDFGTAADQLGLNLSRTGTRGLAKNWLEYQYAWLPLLADAKAAFDLAQQGLNQPLVVSATRDVRDSSTVLVPRWVKKSYSSKEWHAQFLGVPESVELGVKTILHAKIKSAELARLKAFGLVNPLSILWELTPWSFVIDWVVPIGDFLDACTANFGLDFVDGSRTHYLSLDCEYESADGSGQCLKSEPYELGRMSAKLFQMRRRPLTGFPSPKIFGRNHLATSKIVTAAALWRSIRR